MKEKLIEFDMNHNKTIDHFKKLPIAERKILDNYEAYSLISAGEGRAKKGKSNAIRFLVMAEKKINLIDLEDLRAFLKVLKESHFSDYYKNDVKGFVQRFLKWYFKDWSERFNDFEDVKYNTDARRKEKINPEDILSKKEVEKLIKAEPTLFWKTFIIIQYEGALRTLECRKLKWEDIDDNDKEVYWLNISSKKNKNGTEKDRIAPPIKEGIYFLEEMKKQKGKSPYVFPSKLTTNDYISSSSVSKWFERLTKRVLGKSVKSYLLRHSRGEELHKLLREKNLKKENAVMMMGHSEKMFDKTYSHTNREELKEVLKKQVLEVDYIAPQEKNNLRKELEEMKERMEKLEEFYIQTMIDKENKKLSKAIKTSPQVTN